MGEDGRDGFVFLALSTCQNFWLVSHGYASYNDKKGQYAEDVPTSKWQLQVNQQNHMVANKFDPRMDPVVVQVIHIIALKYIPQFLKFLTQQHTSYISPSSLGSASFVKI